MKDNAVLVVGGRTTGMMMAGELARHGVPVRIVDKSPGIDPHSRATYLRARTLEIFHGLGLAEEIVERGQPMKALSLYANGEHVATTPNLPADSPFPWGTAHAQNKTEAVLERHLASFGVEVERSTELVALEQSDEVVHAKIRKPDGTEETFSTPWLVGCDGAHSLTRRLIDENFPGKLDPYPYLGADVIVDGPIRPEIVYICLHDQGDVFFFLLDGGRRQVLATLPKNSERREPPTLEEMQQIVDERGFTDLRLSDPRWLTTYRTHYRLAPHYRQGRVFLAGDAAHIHSVIGGQGLNTGIQDAHNLAWKLALVMRGIAPSWWLDTYEFERRRLAADVISWTKKANDQLTIFSELGSPERERLFEEMAIPEHERFKLRTHEEELDLDYRSCKLCHEPNDGFSAGPHAGARAPDAGPLLIGGHETTMIAAIGGPNHHLLLFSSSHDDTIETELLGVAQQTLETHGLGIDVLVVGAREYERYLPKGATLIEDLHGTLREQYGGDIARLYLIRPDGYVAYRSRHLDRLDEYFTRVLHNQ
ncbi:MAG: FAD-dependent monooxygenase [Pirellulales bacterium]|nr:FAD-dependent monooxygenase [Pirellulales bacterium]